MMQAYNDIPDVYLKTKSIYTINLFFVHLLEKVRFKALQIIKAVFISKHNFTSLNNRVNWIGNHFG